jgi:hypothetical protein
LLAKTAREKQAFWLLSANFWRASTDRHSAIGSIEIHISLVDMSKSPITKVDDSVAPNHLPYQYLF